MRRNGFTLIELMIASVILAVLAAVAIPNYIRAEKRARESEVKSVEHALQVAVEDYKVAPGWELLKPSTAAELVVVVASFLPNTIQNKRNPFNQTQTYGTVGSGLVFGLPGSVGQVGYQYSSQTVSYTILAGGGDAGIIILTLGEGQ